MVLEQLSWSPKSFRLFALLAAQWHVVTRVAGRTFATLHLYFTKQGEADGKADQGDSTRQIYQSLAQHNL